MTFETIFEKTIDKLLINDYHLPVGFEPVIIFKERRQIAVTNKTFSLIELTSRNRAEFARENNMAFCRLHIL